MEVFILVTYASTEWETWSWRVNWSLSVHFKTVQCQLVLFCHFILVLCNPSFSLSPFLPVTFSSLSLLFCTFAFCTLVSFPFPLFFIFYQCHVSLFLTSWLFKHFSHFLSCLFQGICKIASPPVSIFCFSLISFIRLLFVFLSLCLLLSSHKFSVSLSFSLFLPRSPLYASDKHSLLSFTLIVCHFSSTFSVLPLNVSMLSFRYPCLLVLAPSYASFLCLLNVVFLHFHFLSLCSCEVSSFHLLFPTVFLSSCLPVCVCLPTKKLQVTILFWIDVGSMHGVELRQQREYQCCLVAIRVASLSVEWGDCFFLSLCLSVLQTHRTLF